MGVGNEGTRISRYRCEDGDGVSGGAAGIWRVGIYITMVGCGIGHFCVLDSFERAKEGFLGQCAFGADSGRMQYLTDLDAGAIQLLLVSILQPSCLPRGDVPALSVCLSV